VRSLDSGEGKTETVRFVFPYTKFHRRFHRQIVTGSETKGIVVRMEKSDWDVSQVEDMSRDIQ
jgi:hypothetical protein